MIVSIIDENEKPILEVYSAKALLLRCLFNLSILKEKFTLSHVA